MASDVSKKLQVAAYFTLAGGFVLSAFALMKNGQHGSLSQVEPQKAPKALPPKSGAKKPIGKPKTKNYDVGDLDERVALIGDLIRKGSLNSDIREKAVEIVSQKCDMLGRVQPNKKGAKWCYPEKDCMAEVQAIFDALRDPKSKYAVRYVRDAVLADVFTAPERTLLKTNGGDCDDYAITAGSMLMALGHPVRLRIIATRRSGIADADAPWSHIYLLTPTKFDDPDAKWISFDASMNKPLGWEAPGAREVASNGKGSGIVARVKDYTVVKPMEMT
jgi:hypothetical protein